jgi:hypothetical protein
MVDEGLTKGSRSEFALHSRTLWVRDIPNNEKMTKVILGQNYVLLAKH